jgi:flavin-binding protein dodecin
MAQQTETRTNTPQHTHRTAKVIEIVGSSTRGFEDAIDNALADARSTTRGITGAQVKNMSIKCDNGEVTEYKADLKVAFGIERTQEP